jgi:hypothetical protein
MPTESRLPAWLRTAKFLGLPLLVYALFQANCYFPVLRFSNAFANYLIYALTFSLPFLAVIFAIFIPKKWLTRIIAVVLLLPVLPHAAIGGFLVGSTAAETYSKSTDTIKEHIVGVPMDGSTVNIYRFDCGVPCGVGILVYQEKKIFPGVLLVRLLDEFDDVETATYKVMGDNTLRVDVPPMVYQDHPERSFPARSETYHLKRYVYF